MVCRLVWRLLIKFFTYPSSLLSDCPPLTTITACLFNVPACYSMVGDRIGLYDSSYIHSTGSRVLVNYNFLNSLVPRARKGGREILDEFV